MDEIRACDDLIASATGVRDTGLRNALLVAALRHLEIGELGQSAGTEVANGACILDVEAALVHDCWALYPAFGDAALTGADYLAIKKRRVLRELQPQEPIPGGFFRFGSIDPAVRDIRNRHGAASVLPFISESWEQSLILGIDEFFLAAFSEFRCDAFGIDWNECSDELSAAQLQVERDAEPLTILTRARALARHDAEVGRLTGPLASLVQREHATADARLARYRKRPFCEFLRGLFALKPIYYTLRDLYFELHFLATDPDEKAVFEHQETLVDEIQADIGQMMMMPGIALAFDNLWMWAGKSYQKSKSSVYYWLESRAQLNDEMANLLLERLGSANVDLAALEMEIKSLAFESLDPGFKEARSILDERFERLGEEKQ